jgi:hypothetical protein
VSAKPIKARIIKYSVNPWPLFFTKSLYMLSPECLTQTEWHSPLGRAAS